MNWVIAYAATICALAYFIPKMTMIWWQMAMVAQQIDTLTENASQAQFDLSGTDPGGGAGLGGPYA